MERKISKLKQSAIVYISQQPTSSQLLSNVGHLDDPVKYLESGRETTEGVSGGGRRGWGAKPRSEGRRVKPSERPCFYWPILLSTKVNDPGREASRALSWWACTFLSTFIYDCAIKLSELTIEADRLCTCGVQADAWTLRCVQHRWDGRRRWFISRRLSLIFGGVAAFE